MDLREVVITKRDGGTLSSEQIDAFLKAYVAGEAPEHLASALLAVIFTRGMSGPELGQWTRGMLHSGVTLDFKDLGLPLVDKHSTGGVGDKVSIALAPAVAACGAAIPMVSGRGLGHTGGTLDKLEAIPGFSTDLDVAAFKEALKKVGYAIGGQTADLVPADRKLYALRDACGLVEAIPLIASSILSKKLAEGIDGLVLDVKYGSGAFLPEPERGRELAAAMRSIASELGLPCTVFQTTMTRPLGRSIGHALEIVECIACLRGGGPPDLRELVLVFGAEMLRLAGLEKSTEGGRERIAEALDSGTALERFERSVAFQGGDPRVAHDPKLLPHAPNVETVVAETSGALRYSDVRGLGRTVALLGGGRMRLEDRIDPAVGLICLRHEGERVERGEALFEIHHRGAGLGEAQRSLAASFELGEEFDPSALLLPPEPSTSHHA